MVVYDRLIIGVVCFFVAYASGSLMWIDGRHIRGIEIPLPVASLHAAPLPDGRGSLGGEKRV